MLWAAKVMSRFFFFKRFANILENSVCSAFAWMHYSVLERKNLTNTKSKSGGPALTHPSHLHVQDREV